MKVAATEAARRKQEQADEVIIKQKMDAGLSRDQAVAVIARQRKHDETLAAQRAERLPALLEIIRRHKKDLRTARRTAREDFPFLDGGEWEAALESFNKTPAKA